MQYDKSLIKALLSLFKEGEEHYTHHFSICGPSSLRGNDNRPLLRNYLNYMKEHGYVEKHKYPHNVHRWSITKDGIGVLRLFQSDPFIN